jgi:myo-inositol 2-dehydrogenase / D-chiro-inositol 1-dehydrogenase
MHQIPPNTTRRDFLKSSAAAGSVLAAGSLLNVHAQGGDALRVGIVGCGGRGSGAIEQCLRAGTLANPQVNIRLVAMGDAFRDRATALRNRLRNNEAVRDRVDVPDDRVYVGLDAYQQVINNVDLVVLATPPGFRPIHLRAAVAARKNIFTEKPVAVDGPGIRSVLQAYEEANRHQLTIVAGLQRRYQTEYLESMKKIHDGALGTITSARCYWNQGGLWHTARTAQMTDLEWQIRNWLYFTWLSGDHICEQHVHNLDVVNWALGNAHPIRATGMGGRQSRTGPEFGHIFDHFAVEYEYPNNVHVLSQCRQIDGCANSVAEAVTGTKGSWASSGYRITGENAWTLPPGPLARGRYADPYQLEHVALLQSIRGNGPKINNLKSVAESTLTAIMGRMSCYTGQSVTWDNALNSTTNLMPENLAWDMNLPVPPVARARS